LFNKFGKSATWKIKNPNNCSLREVFFLKIFGKLASFLASYLQLFRPLTPLPVFTPLLALIGLPTPILVLLLPAKSTPHTVPFYKEHPHEKH
jgi:uncharacterized membrane protein